MYLVLYYWCQGFLLLKNERILLQLRNYLLLVCMTNIFREKNPSMWIWGLFNLSCVVTTTFLLRNVTIKTRSKNYEKQQNDTTVSNNDKYKTSTFNLSICLCNVAYGKKIKTFSNAHICTSEAEGCNSKYALFQ